MSSRLSPWTSRCSGRFKTSSYSRNSGGDTRGTSWRSATASKRALLAPRRLRNDAYHERALALASRVEAAIETVITEAVLMEIGDALSDKDRAAAADFIRACYETPNMTVVPVTTELLSRAIDRYQGRPDKTWGLTDCLSFVVMEDLGLTVAATGDWHFRQAGFDALLAAD